MTTNKYNDIIDLPHHVSLSRKRMSNIERAAQFSPFAALTGHEAAIEETARLTETKRDPDDEIKKSISDKLSYLVSQKQMKYPVYITYFIHDEKKDGGRYSVKKCTVNNIDSVTGIVTLEPGGKIMIDDIYDISGEIFDKLGY